MAQDKKNRGQGDQNPNMGEMASGMTGKNYSETEIRTVLGRGEFHSWNDVIQWLDRNGTRESGLNAQSVNSLRDDMQRLQNQGAEFTKDPSRIMQMIQRQGGQR